MLLFFFLSLKLLFADFSFFSNILLYLFQYSVFRLTPNQFTFTFRNKTFTFNILNQKKIFFSNNNKKVSHKNSLCLFFEFYGHFLIHFIFNIILSCFLFKEIISLLKFFTRKTVFSPSNIRLNNLLDLCVATFSIEMK